MLYLDGTYWNSCNISFFFLFSFWQQWHSGMEKKKAGQEKWRARRSNASMKRMARLVRPDYNSTRTHLIPWYLFRDASVCRRNPDRYLRSDLLSVSDIGVLQIVIDMASLSSVLLLVLLIIIPLSPIRLPVRLVLLDWISEQFKIN